MLRNPGVGTSRERMRRYARGNAASEATIQSSDLERHLSSPVKRRWFL